MNACDLFGLLLISSLCALIGERIVSANGYINNYELFYLSFTIRMHQDLFYVKFVINSW